MPFTQNTMNGQGYLHLNVIALKVCSMYPHAYDANFFEILLDWTYKIINVIALYFSMIPPLYEIYLREKNGVASYAMDIVNSCCYICTVVTIHFFHVRGGEARKLVEEMNNLFKWKSNGLTEKDMSENSKITRKITIGFTSLTTVGVLMMGLLPLFDRFVFKTTERMLPVPGTYPFNNYKESPFYEIIYLIQMHAQIVMGALTGAGDSFFVCMVLTTAAQFEVLANDFYNCLYNALLEHGVSKENVLDFLKTFRNSEDPSVENECAGRSNHKTSVNQPNLTSRNNLVLNTINSEAFEKKLHKLFVGYVRHHQNLLTFCVKMDLFFLPFIFMKTSVNMFYNVFFAFALVTNANDTTLTLSLGQYQLCALAELFLYSTAGQAIITKSEELRERLYFSPWYTCNRKYKVLVLMVLMRSSRAARISVAKLYDMSHATFIMILKAAMSYFAVLRQVMD